MSFSKEIPGFKAWILCWSVGFSGKDATIKGVHV